MKANFSVLTGLLILQTILSPAQPGTLDNDFDADGKVITDFAGGDDYGSAMAIQQDGKIVIAGSSSGEFLVARYHPDGSLDHSFDLDGFVTTAVLNEDFALSLVLQPDGKIIVTGSAFESIAVVRYNTDGSLDASFGTGGIIIKRIGGFAGGRSVVLQTDGKILIAGGALFESDNFVILRYNTDGSNDNTFSFDGTVTTDFNGRSDKATSIHVLADGKILVTGYSQDRQGGLDSDFALAKYNTDGTLDRSFGTNGQVITDILNRRDFGRSAVIQADQKILLAGSSVENGENGESDFALLRYEVNGTLDSTFGFDGIVITAIGFNNSYARAITLQPDGKILVAGGSYNGDGDFALARYNVDGSIDLTFSSGIVSTDFGGAEETGTSVLVQADGKILVAGQTFNGTDPDFAMARYISGLNVGIVNFSKESGIPLIYPNPVNHAAQLEFELIKDEVIDVLLYDMSGKLVQSIMRNVHKLKGQNRITLNFNNSITAGNYLLVISSTEGKQAIKILIE